MRLTYLELVSRLQRYIDAFADCGNGKPATIAIGTNNDGAWDPHGDNYYKPADRGHDWAYNVVNLLTSAEGVTAIGANDIEPGFASTEAQALTWEKSYLGAANTNAWSSTGRPTAARTRSARPARSAPATTPSAASTSWPPITAGSSRSRRSTARAWPPSGRTSTGSAAGSMRFGGVLTEHALAPDQYTPANGWTALYWALASVGRAPTLPAASDITNG